MSIFTTPEASKAGVYEPPWPDHSGLVGFSAREVRRRHPDSDVNHHPIVGNTGKKNYAHSMFSKYLSTGQSKRLIEKTFTVVQVDLVRLFP